MRRHWPVAAILIVAAVARLWGIHFGLPHLNARPDEGTIASIAGGMYHGDLNPHFFNYPALFMTSVAAVLSLVPDPFGTTTPYMIARYLSAGAGIASVLVLFRIGQRLFGQAAGLASAALLAVAFLHVRDSHFGVTDVPMTFLVARRVLVHPSRIRIRPHKRRDRRRRRERPGHIDKVQRGAPRIARTARDLHE